MNAAELPFAANAGLFAGGAVVVWFAGSKLARYGLIERRDRVFLRMGYDSIAVLLAYAGGLAVLYAVR